MRFVAHITIAALVAAAVLPLSPRFRPPVARPARAGDDPVKLKEKRDAYRKKQAEAGVLCYLDLNHGVNRGTKPEDYKIDGRWSMDAPQSDWKEKEGIQFSAKFADSKFPEGAGIAFLVQKFPHKDGNSVFNLPLEKSGLKPSTADPKGVIEGMYAEHTREFKDLSKDKCVQSKKVKYGPAELFSTIYGMKDGKKARLDFFVWTGPNRTYLARADYSGICAEKAEAFEEKVFDLLKQTKELKAPD